MTVTREAEARPAIHIRQTDADRVGNLAVDIEGRQPQLADLLLTEIDRATVVPDDQLPPDTVAMASTVTFVDDATGAERTVTLVYPQDADIDAGRISILSLIGAGLLGLKTGQSISWPDRTGKQRVLRIIAVN